MFYTVLLPTVRFRCNFRGYILPKNRTCNFLHTYVIGVGLPTSLLPDSSQRCNYAHFRLWSQKLLIFISKLEVSSQYCTSISMGDFCKLVFLLTISKRNFNIDIYISAYSITIYAGQYLKREFNIDSSLRCNLFYSDSVAIKPTAPIPETCILHLFGIFLTLFHQPWLSTGAVYLHGYPTPNHTHPYPTLPPLALPASMSSREMYSTWLRKPGC